MNCRFWIPTATLAAVLWAPLPAAQKSEGPAPRSIDLNTASALDLMAIPDITAAQAAMLVQIRELNGPFQSVEEVRMLPRVNKKQLRQMRRYLTIGAADDILNSSDHEPRHGADPPR